VVLGDTLLLTVALLLFASDPESQDLGLLLVAASMVVAGCWPPRVCRRTAWSWS